ncbi:MAG: type II toxin-antitoxin system HicA family toxin [Syntrophobacteraceae bacterium]
MTHIPSLSFKQLISVVERLGFARVRQRGSHIRFAHDDGRKTTIPDHGNKSVPKGRYNKNDDDFAMNND